ncbi:MAG: hypothetical protein D6762_06165 [Candidatus Neomarinimicrobiota bacterium]|nr:MAG: hypothetical protein D6762_06165 [Candidatus Neomarinimicrobiota bacterium]
MTPSASAPTGLSMKRIQYLLIALVWLLLFALPILVGSLNEGIRWDHIVTIWKEYGYLVILFLGNRFFLMPRLFLQGKRLAYVLAILALILGISALSYVQAAPSPPPGHPAAVHLAAPPERQPPFPERGPRELIPPFANILILGILLVGFDSGLLFFTKWTEAEQNRLQLEKESIAHQMAFLRNQVSPHFLMNTLNNIHALIDINTEEARHALIRLSRLMDYMLRKAQAEEVRLTEELDFLTNYVDLMKLRLTDHVQLDVTVPDSVPEVTVPPLLPIAFLENAFKYGVSYEQPSFISIAVQVDEATLQVRIRNQVQSTDRKGASTGIGIANTRQRLELLYGDRYGLDITDDGHIYDVNLRIPL